jgi:hypothetical protein
MSRFWKDAVQVLETAIHVPHDGFSSDLALIVDSIGGLRIVSATGWGIEGLRSEHGGAVYHVTRSGHYVCVEGRAGDELPSARSVNGTAATAHRSTESSGAPQAPHLVAHSGVECVRHRNCQASAALAFGR